MARMSAHEIAQLNVGRAVAPLDSPVMAGFINWLDEINALAERHPGFVWRLQGDNGNNTSLKVTDDPLFIVISASGRRSRRDTTSPTARPTRRSSSAGTNGSSG
jgi:hypothetical protein